MKVLVDSTVWSLVLRRKSDANRQIAEILEQLILEGRAQMMGSIRQEVLSGIAHPAQYEKLRLKLRAFPDLLLTSEHYERAAQMFNQCRAQGIQGSHTDFLLCAVAQMEKLEVFTLDKDFERYADVLNIQLYELE